MVQVPPVIRSVPPVGSLACQQRDMQRMSASLFGPEYAGSAAGSLQV